MKLTERTRHERDRKDNRIGIAWADGIWRGRQGRRAQWVREYLDLEPGLTEAKAGRRFDRQLRRKARHTRKLRQGWA